jgi:hypothetical protein
MGSVMLCVQMRPGHGEFGDFGESGDLNRAASAKLELFLIDFQGFDSVVERR